MVRTDPVEGNQELLEGNQELLEGNQELHAGRRRRRLDRLIAILLGGGAFGLYVLTLAPTVLGGDGGEFQFVPYLLGVAHPTGYPLYTLLGWVWSHLLPVGDPSSASGLGVAYRMNLFSAFWAALAVALLYPTARALLRQAFPPSFPPARGGEGKGRRLVAILATVTFAVTPTLWSQAVRAEVYGLHIFFVVLLFYLVLTWGEKAGNGIPAYKHLLLAAFCFGLGLAHHSTTVLLAPAILAYIYLTKVAGSKPALSIAEGLQVARGSHARHNLPLTSCLLPLAACIFPLLLYLYIPLRAPHTPYLRQPLTPDRELVLYENTLTNLLDFVSGGPFGGSVDFSVDLGERLAMTWGFLLDEVTWLGVVLAAAGIVQLALSRRWALLAPNRRWALLAPNRRWALLAPNRRWALLALTGLACIATVAFNLVYTIGDVYVLYIPSYLVVALWMAVGVRTLLGIGKLGNWKFPQAVKVALVLILFAWPVWMVLTRYADLDQSQNTRARTRWEAILAEPLPPDAVLVSNDRNNIMPLWYFQYVDAVRPDLLGLFPLITPEYPTLGHVLDLALSTGRPTYLIKEMPGVEVKVEIEAEGLLWRVLGPAAVGGPAYPLDAQLDDSVALVGYDRAPHSPRPGETLQVSLYWEALRPLEAEYHSFVHMLDAAGQIVAQSDHQPGGVYYPTTLWRPGERLRDDHLLAVPDDAPTGVYRLLAGMYAFADDGSLIPLGEPVVVGQVGVKAEVQIETQVRRRKMGNGMRNGIKTVGLAPNLASGFYGQDIISVRQFSRENLAYILGVADEMRAIVKRVGSTDLLKGHVLACVFYEPSTRTSSSFVAAMSRLGGSVIPINEVRYSSVTKGESLPDTIRTLESYADVIVLRHPEVGASQVAAEYARKPIVNAGDGVGEHPTQALLDLYTIQTELGQIDGLHVAMVGDLRYGRTVHSLARLLSLFDVEMTFVSPEILRLPLDVMNEIKAVGRTVRETYDVHDVIANVDVLYVTRVQRERFADQAQYDTVKDCYVITPELMDQAKEKMIVMHPLPRVGEISYAIDDDPRAAYFRQMENGMYIRMALLAAVLGKA